MSNNFQMYLNSKNNLTENDSQILIELMQAGISPSISQWINILKSLHVKTVFQCLSTIDQLDPVCLFVVIKRQHPGLFLEVLKKIESIPPKAINLLMSTNAFYLNHCLLSHLNPNTPLSNKQTPLAHAVTNSKFSHIGVILANPKTIVSGHVCCLMFRHPRQLQFTSRACQICNQITLEFITEALVANTSTALTVIMQRLEEKHKGNRTWTEICYMLRCPITLEYSTDLVQTPSQHLFDRESLLTWVRRHSTNPMTREHLTEPDFIERPYFLSEFLKDLHQKYTALHNHIEQPKSTAQTLY